VISNIYIIKNCLKHGKIVFIKDAALFPNGKACNETSLFNPDQYALNYLSAKGAAEIKRNRKVAELEMEIARLKSLKFMENV
jgi:hypothetical protein